MGLLKQRRFLLHIIRIHIKQELKYNRDSYRYFSKEKEFFPKVPLAWRLYEVQFSLVRLDLTFDPDSTPFFLISGEVFHTLISIDPFKI